MKVLLLNDIPVFDDLLQFVLMHGVEKIDLLRLSNCKITNKIVENIVERIVKRINKRENKVLLFLSSELSLKKLLQYILLYSARTEVIFLSLTDTISLSSAQFLNAEH